MGFFDTKFGTSPHKLHRRNAPQTSIDAAYEVDTSRLEKLVFEEIRTFGKKGCISDRLKEQCRKKHGIQTYSSITGRYAALIDKKLIVRGPDTRQGDSGSKQGVMRAVECTRGTPAENYQSDRRRVMSKARIQKIAESITKEILYGRRRSQKGWITLVIKEINK